MSSVLNGTETVKKAFSNMAKGIIEDVVKYAIKWAVEHAFAATQVMAMNTTVAKLRFAPLRCAKKRFASLRSGRMEGFSPSKRSKPRRLAGGF